MGNTWGPPPPTLPHLPNSIAASAQEVSILSKLAHSNVVRFIGACTSRPNLCIVCELMPGGSVSDLLRRVRKGVMPVCRGGEGGQREILGRLRSMVLVPAGGDNNVTC